MEAETRVAVIAIIVNSDENVPKLNDLLHEAAPYIVGRMGIPYRKRGISVISVVIDAPQDVISSISGRIGKLPGINTKTTYSNIIAKNEDA